MGSRYLYVVGRENGTMASTALAIVKRLIESTDLVQRKGRIVYTDNWYTRLVLAKVLFGKYSRLLVGTITPIDKKDRKLQDIPFLKLSNVALQKVVMGWILECNLSNESSIT